ncbi:MAG: 2-amino-4-hydroxy-6-hydroxymethyldihydropteridine diphosphokinase [Burkholderiales bacterium]
MKSSSVEEPPVCAFIGVGANLGDPPSTLAQACRALAVSTGNRLVAMSSLYRSKPVDASGPDFYNAVVKIETRLAPQALLDATQAIERQHGRRHPYRNAPRTLDLDLLLYGDQTLVTDRLTVPHPRLGERAFALLPLLEIHPALKLPGVADAAVWAHKLARAQGIERLDFSWPSSALP